MNLFLSIGQLGRGFFVFIGAPRGKEINSPFRIVNMGHSTLLFISLILKPSYNNQETVLGTAFIQYCNILKDNTERN